jgi:hypothetical protein
MDDSVGHFPKRFTSLLFGLSYILFKNFKCDAHYSFHFEHLDSFMKSLDYFSFVYAFLALFCLKHSFLELS